MPSWRGQAPLTRALRQLNRNSDAIRAFGQATRLAPGEAPAWLGLGLSLESEGRPGEAAEALDRYLALQSNGAEAESVRARRARLSAGSAPTPSQAAPDEATPRRGP
jgi:cytochrome c-type biogenesis protein CcmH/NrfG